LKAKLVDIILLKSGYSCLENAEFVNWAPKLWKQLFKIEEIVVVNITVLYT